MRKAHKLVAQTLAATKFACAPLVTVAARPATAAQQASMAAAAAVDMSMAASGATTDGSASGPAEAAAGAAPLPPQGVQGVAEALLSRVRPRLPAAGSDPFLFYVDHCFAIKGQGTILTGEWMS